MLRVCFRREHKLQSKWRSPMRVKEAKSSLVFVVKHSVKCGFITVHAQRMIPYSAKEAEGRTLEQPNKQATRYDAGYYLVDKIPEFTEKNGGYDLRIKWMILGDKRM